jgi:hypothetical protein
MGWTGANPVTVGNPTKKSDYDKAFDNTLYVSTNVIPAGTKSWFYQNVAPVGWTIDATPADAVLAVKGGSNAYNVNGGTQAGTWTQPNHSHTAGSLAGASHTHNLPIGRKTDDYLVHGFAVDEYDSGASLAVSYTDTLTVSGCTIYRYKSQGATVGISGSTENSATPNTYRPLAQVGIICTKDAYA